MSSNQEDGANEGARPLQNLQLQALIGEMQRMMRAELESIHERLDRVEDGTPRRHQQDRITRPQRRHAQGIDVEEDEEVIVEDFDEQNYNRGRIGHRGDRNGTRRNNDLRGIKMKIPTFQGRNDPEAYLEWETKMEMVFDCHEFSEFKKVKLAAIEFTDYAIVWWDQVVMTRRRNREQPVSTWEEINVLMRRRFVPSHYYRSLYHRL